jgi:D-alanyl-D-alanine carboxypeptidase/D-alanyl-D-alanine-endopeptidase (penicillin-binding protein 4)
MRTLPLLLLGALLCHADTLEDRIRTAIESSPDAVAGFWGIRVVDAESAEIVFEQHEKQFFVPASNTKLFTTALALFRLGPDFRFHTIVETDTAPGADGTVRDLQLIGGGDPNLSARILPYRHGEEGLGKNALVSIEALADQLVARGVRTVEGDIVGDDTAYEWDPYPNGWAIDDPTYEYGAPVSALTLNDNAFKLEVQPGSGAGEPARIRILPPVEHLTIHNRTRTVDGELGRLRFDRPPGSSELVVSGDIGTTSPVRTTLLAVDDPALFAAQALRHALLERGVQVRGSARAVHRKADSEPVPARSGMELARHTSAPLDQVLQVINKVSQNLHTELVLREIARQKSGFGTREEGLAEIKAFLAELGVDEKQYRFEDASGLSRLTLVTPELITKLLVYMYGSQHRQRWLATLPAGGVDGTLYNRFAGAKEGANIRAKTGSISHVGALSGYALRADGRTYAFSILVNNFNSEHASVRKVMDEVALALLE